MHILQRAALVVLLTVAHATLAIAQTASPTPSAPTRPEALGRIEGQVFDSLRFAPLRQAQVWVPGTTLSAVSNDKGHFTLDSVPQGRHLVTFATAALDSLGLGTLGAMIDVKAGQTSNVKLGSPSGATLRKVLCASRPQIGPDSGMVWGAVRDAATGNLVAGASALFKWYEFKPIGKKLSFNQLSTRVETDSTGMFYACGLPTDVAFAATAITDEGASGDVEFAIGERQLLRVNFLVSADMKSHGQMLAENRSTAGEPAAHGTATLTGVVRDELNRVVGDALVSMASADTAVRTNKDGTFTLRNLPAGTQGVQVRSVGYGMVTQLIDLHPNAAMETRFVLPLNTTLAVFNVRAQAVMKADQADYLHRRMVGLGYAFEFKPGDPDPLQVIRSAPRVNITYLHGEPTIVFPDGRASCIPEIFLDGMKVDATMMQTYPVDHLRAVEVITSKYSVPAQFLKTSINGCGVVLYWSKNRW